MCAYNVRKNKSVDHEPPSGPARTLDLIREAGIWSLGLGVMYLVYWLAQRFLF
jgi:hypothetical protein